jgi:hypothetical protein
MADEGGIFTDESRYDVGTMLTVLNAARAFAITVILSTRRTYSRMTATHCLRFHVQ